MNDQAVNNDEQKYTDGAFPATNESNRPALTSVADDNDNWDPLKDTESTDDDDLLEEDEPIDDGTEENEPLEEEVGDDDLEEEDTPGNSGI